MLLSLENFGKPQVILISVQFYRSAKPIWAGI